MDESGTRLVWEYARGVTYYTIDSIFTTSVLAFGVAAMMIPVGVLLSELLDLDPVVVMGAFLFPILGFSFTLGQNAVSEPSSGRDDTKSFVDRRFDDLISFTYINFVILLAVAFGLFSFFIAIQVTSTSSEIPSYILIFVLFSYGMVDPLLGAKRWWASPAIWMTALVLSPLHAIGKATKVQLSSIPVKRVFLVELWENAVRSRGGITR